MSAAPGPYTTRHNHHDDSVDILDANGWLITTIEQGTDDAPGYSQHTAALLAASWDLREALRKQHCMGCAQRIGDPDRQPDYPCPTCKDSRATLRKATE